MSDEDEGFSDMHPPMDRSAMADRQSAMIYQVESSKLIPVLIMVSCLSVVIAAAAVVFAIDAKSTSAEARATSTEAMRDATRSEKRCDLAQLEIESFKNVLHALHLPTSAHLPGESP